MSLAQSFRNSFRKDAAESNSKQSSASKNTGFTRQDMTVRFIWIALIAFMTWMVYLHGTTGRFVLDVSVVLFGIIAGSTLAGLGLIAYASRHSKMDVRNADNKLNLLGIVGLLIIYLVGVAAFLWPLLMESFMHTTFLVYAAIAATTILGSMFSRKAEVWLVGLISDHPQPDQATNA